MTLHSDKDLKSKKFNPEKSLYISQAKVINSKRKFEIKAKKGKGLFFRVALFQAIVSITLRLFYKILFTKYCDPQNISLLTLL